MRPTLITTPATFLTPARAPRVGRLEPCSSPRARRTGRSARCRDGLISHDAAPSRASGRQRTKVCVGRRDPGRCSFTPEAVVLARLLLRSTVLLPDRDRKCRSFAGAEPHDVVGSAARQGRSGRLESTPHGHSVTPHERVSRCKRRWAQRREDRPYRSMRLSLVQGGCAQRRCRRSSVQRGDPGAVGRAPGAGYLRASERR